MARSCIQLIEPDWPAPPGVVAFSTTRTGGVSSGCYESLNLAMHVGDETANVERNRTRLISELGLSESPRWLNQVHGRRIVSVDGPGDPLTADGAVASVPNVACVVMTADCLPILLCDRTGQHIGAVHAGWRGLASGVIAGAVDTLVSCGADRAGLLAWLGPAIGPDAYEVGRDVYDAAQAADAGSALMAGSPGHWQLDLYAFARRRLHASGVEQIYGGDFCTYADPRRFFSYRRDGVCGRQATMIWRRAVGSGR